MVNTIEEADFVLIPNTINAFFDNKVQKHLIDLNENCAKNNKKAFGFIADDFGYSFPVYSNIIYFRLGGFKSKLSSKNLGFPVSLSDFLYNFYNQTEIIPKTKKEIPSIGFCGYASFSFLKKNKIFVSFY